MTTANAVTVAAPAKVNLTLHITVRRANGYHDLSSLVVFLPEVADQVTVAPAEDLNLTVTGPASDGVPDGPSNLIIQAAERLRDLRGVTSGAAIHLEKYLPSGGGIGGGSSDAAAAIKGLARLWNVAPLTGAEALSLGADLPVCLAGPAPQVMTGIGEDVAAASPLPPLWLVLINPGIHVSTPQIFGARAAAELPFSPDLDPLPGPDMDDFALWLLSHHNDLTMIAADLTPEIAGILRECWDLDNYVDADMSGSGSTCWVLFESEADATAGAERLRALFPSYWIASGQVARATT